ncbi:MAG: M20/M25/M40 family metallo-hydrolase [Spirochaetales bacterium]
MNPQSIVAERAVPLLQTLIRNACVNTGSDDSGDEVRSIEYLRDYLASYNIESETFALRERRPNLVARIPGRDPEAPSLAYMGHVDVVPADADKWTRDPFGGELIDGEVWGRGAVDMLGMVATSAAAMTVLAEGAPPPGDVMLIIVSDEEAGGTFGAEFLTSTYPQKVACDYMIGEVGGLHLDTRSGPGITLSVGEKGVCWATLRFSGVPGHGSMPYGADNAAVKAGLAASRLAGHESAPWLSPVIRDMAKAFLPENIDLKSALTKEGFPAALARLYERNPGTAKFLHTAAHTTISPNVLASGSKVNIVPDSAELTLDIRMLPDWSREDVAELVNTGIGELAGEGNIDIFEFFPSNVSDRDTPLMRATERLVSEILPGTRVVPMFMGGVTDGRYWRKLGTTVYGFAANDRWLSMDRFSTLIHGIDERISVRCLERNLEYLVRLPEALISQ